MNTRQCEIRSTKLARRIIAMLVLAATLGVVPSAIADGGGRQPPPTRYIDECASCHAPFPAGMLPATSWKALMSSLNKHFGTDASVDAPTVQALSAWLTDNASRRTTTRPPEDRLTLGGDFLRKHREVSAAVWLRPSIRKASNCAACHTNSAQGRFSDNDVRIPK